MSSTEKNSEVVVENVEAEEKATGDAKELKGTKRPAEDKCVETKKAKKEENGADEEGEDDELIEEEEEEDEEYGIPFGEEDELDGEEEEEEAEEDDEIDEDA